MSKERAVRRAEREAATAQRLAQAATQRERLIAARRRREQRLTTLRRLNPWTKSHRPGLSKEQRAALLTGILIVLLIVYFGTQSITYTVLVALAALIITPAVIALMKDRRSR